MSDRFFTVAKCDRCGASLEGGRIMSMFNTDCICMDCHRKEQELPEFKQAADAEIAEIRQRAYFRDNTYAQKLRIYGGNKK